MIRVGHSQHQELVFHNLVTLQSFFSKSVFNPGKVPFQDTIGGTQCGIMSQSDLKIVHRMPSSCCSAGSLCQGGLPTIQVGTSWTMFLPMTICYLTKVKEFLLKPLHVKLQAVCNALKLCWLKSSCLILAAVCCGN